MDEIETLAGLGKVCDKLVDMPSALRDMPEIMAGRALTEKIRKGAVLLRKDFKSEKKIESNRYVKIVDRNKNLISVLDVDGKSNQVKYCCVFS
jgi:tRNA U55 pseudouridine synthase TruB